jgi:polysaccharide pyruvyl transferase WcaK-like protein
MARLRELVLLGYYGAGNIGDDLMLQGLLCELLSADPEIVVHVVSYYQKPVKVPDSPRVRIVRGASLAKKLIRILPLFWRCQVALFGGGTPFTDTEGDGSYKFFRLAHLLNCRIGYLGIGLGRLERIERKKRTRWLLQHCALATFRDPTSLSRAQALIGGDEAKKMHLCEDLCYLYMAANPLPQKVINPKARPMHLVISWRELRGEEGVETDEYLMYRFIDSIRLLHMVRGLADVTLLPLDLTADLDAHTRLARLLDELLPGVKVSTSLKPAATETISTIAASDLYISVRLHGAFIGKVVGVPTIGFIYSPKVRYYFESIGSSSMLEWSDLGRDEGCLVRSCTIAITEATRPIDLTPRIALARQNVLHLLRLLK